MTITIRNYCLGYLGLTVAALIANFSQAGLNLCVWNVFDLLWFCIKLQTMNLRCVLKRLGELTKRLSELSDVD